MKINHRLIGPDFSPYLIAELGANHNGSAYQGKLLIDAAKDSGADAVKLQCYSADDICVKGDIIVESEAWRGQNLYELYKEAETPPTLVQELFQYAQRLGIDCFSSVFSFSGADFCIKLGMPAIKIASFELIDTPLIEYCAKSGLPLIISTGMGSSQEIIDAINAVRAGRKAGERPAMNLALLHCISSYPALAADANLPALGPLSELLGGQHIVGFSDHTLGIGSAVAATAYGACFIEKHFILDRSAGGPDASFSMQPTEFAALVKACREAHDAIQPRAFAQSPSENAAYRKSIWTVLPVEKGEPFSRENCRILRPSGGLMPKFYGSVLGSVANHRVEAGTPVLASMVSALS